MSELRPRRAHGIERHVGTANGSTLRAPLELDFLADGNPLVAVHCMAAADVLLRLGGSHLSGLAALFSNGRDYELGGLAERAAPSAAHLAEALRKAKVGDQ